MLMCNECLATCRLSEMVTAMIDHGCFVLEREHYGPFEASREVRPITETKLEKPRTTGVDKRRKSSASNQTDPRTVSLTNHVK